MEREGEGGGGRPMGMEVVPESGRGQSGAQTVSLWGSPPNGARCPMAYKYLKNCERMSGLDGKKHWNFPECFPGYYLASMQQVKSEGNSNNKKKWALVLCRKHNGGTVRLD